MTAGRELTPSPAPWSLHETGTVLPGHRPPRGLSGIHGAAWHLVCSPISSSFPFLVLSLIASQMLSKRESQRKPFSLRAECCQKTIVSLGFPFPWGLFLYGECEMAIFPVSVMRKQKYCFSLPHCLCCAASSQVPAFNGAAARSSRRGK